ncbi:MAG: TonB-dependent receptor [Bacteroidetes bacterium]|nr:TonB-dependent receptor [Bacteroidota bacterium]
MKIFILFIFLSLSVNLFGQSDSVKTSVVKGTVKNSKGKLVEGANVVIEGTIDGSTTDEKGFYEFETSKTGKRVIIFTAVDFGEKKINADIEPGSTLILDVTLSNTEFKTDEITVTASSFTSGENSKVTLSPLEITRIPGADADLYRAITTFPGSNQVDEGSRIAVRGGDPSEVLTFLDGASLYNPFLFGDDYNTSSYSTVNPWGMKGINFSSGGFSAKYGNVLSAVLDLQSYDLPQGRGMFAILGLANVGLSGVYRTNDGKFGATFSAGQFFIKPFLEVNKDNTDFSPIPTASNIGGTLVYKTSRTGLLKYYLNYSYDNMGIRNESPTYSGYYLGRTKNFFTNLKYSFAPTDISLLSTSVSLSTNNRTDKYGVLNTVSNSLYGKVRTDFGTPVSEKIDLSTGIEYEYNDAKENGKAPVYFYNMREEAPYFNLDFLQKTGRAGAYAELKYRLSDNFLIQGGVRSDYYTLTKDAVVDPRLSVVFRFTQHSFLKAATGIYHQFPALLYFLQGNTTSLKPEQAIHYILGYEYNRDNDFILRLETFYKDYSKLVSNSYNYYNYTSDGKGVAKGVDAFLKIRIKPKFNGWISYSYVDSKRTPYDGANTVSADFDITHTLSVVSEYNISDYFTVGATYKLSTGKPYTPVIGSIFDAAQNAYIPIYAERNSGRFPTYTRIDLNAQYIFALFGRFAVAFLALNNIMNTSNLYEYSYNFDYTQKKTINSSNFRTIYFGIGLQL